MEVGTGCWCQGEDDVLRASSWHRSVTHTSHPKEHNHLAPARRTPLAPFERRLTPVYAAPPP